MAALASSSPAQCSFLSSGFPTLFLLLFLPQCSLRGSGVNVLFRAEPSNHHFLLNHLLLIFSGRKEVTFFNPLKVTSGFKGKFQTQGHIDGPG